MQAPIGGNAELEIFRGGVRITRHVTIRTWPESKPDAALTKLPRKLGLELASGRRVNGEPTVTVAAVDPSGTAADSGLQTGDIILEVQQNRVSEAGQALRLFQAQSVSKHSFAAVLVERGKMRTWIPICVPD